MIEAAATIPMQDYQLAGPGSDFVAEFQALFAQSRLLDVFDAESVTILADYMQVYRMPAGAPVLKEGERSDYAVLLLAGEVNVLKSHSSGTAQSIALITPGKLIGEMSLIDREPRFASCVAQTEVVFAVLTRQALLDLLDEHPKLGSLFLMRLVALVSTRLRNTSARLVALMAQHNS
ncbi:MAG: cyclic nucleotide-binding domain-containing protein [Burkholderiales bacterium]|nr:cyclic nucleotide-binding domain-containing protein [Burkholderiales bacterium]